MRRHMVRKRVSAVADAVRRGRARTMGGARTAVGVGGAGEKRDGQEGGGDLERVS